MTESRTCPIDGQQFAVRCYNHRYCSPRCATQAQAAQHAAWMAAHPNYGQRRADPLYLVRSYRKGGSTRRDREGRYGLPPGWLDAQMERQDGKCAVCLEPLPLEESHIDHNHDTGEVRGLLCRGCNYMLAHAKESAQVLRRATAYVIQSNAASVHEIREAVA